MREATRALIRIITNYIRLGLNLALGLVFVPFTLHWIGNDPQGLIGLLGAGVGIPAMFREITNRASVRELGAALHQKDQAHFRTIFNATLAIAAIASAISAAFFTVLYFVLPHLDIPHHLDPAAKTMVIASGAYMVVTTALCPIYNMLVVSERFVQYNIWVLAERSCLLASAIYLKHVAGITDPGEAVAKWSILVAVSQLALFLIPVGHMLASNAEFRPRLGLITRDAVRSVASTVTYYVLVEVASNCYERVSAFIINIYFGLFGNTIYSIAFQFVSYVRQATQGVTFGLDAVSARLSHAGQKSIKALIHHSTRVHGLVAIPAGAAVFILARPFIVVWVRKQIEDPDRYLPEIVLFVTIMSVALTARAISDGWMMILYGAGHIRRYARLVVLGGLANPFVACFFTVILKQQGSPLALYAVPVTFSFIYSIFHFLLLPRVAAQCIEIRYRDLFIPLIRPAIATAICSPILFSANYVVHLFVPHWNLTALAGTGLVFGLAYAIAATFIVLSKEERQRFIAGPLKRILRR